jgi:uncharacterized protein (DUF736 family)
MKKSALIIGEFKKTETGFTGTLQTLAVKANISLHPNDDKQKDNHPDYIIQHGQNEIGVAWERSDDRGYHVSLSFEEPSLAAGYYTLVKSDKGISVYDLLYRKPMPKKEAK